MHSRNDLHGYQTRAVEFAKEHERAIFSLDMSLGKTVSTLTVIADLLDRARIRGALVLAPRRVVESVWKQEAAQWKHIAWLKVAVLRGSKPAMTRKLLMPYDVWVINYEMLPWLASELNHLFLAHGRPLPFDLLVLDELTRVKTTTGTRVNNLYPFLPFFRRRLGLTGTIAPNGYQDLFGQLLAIDDGERLCNGQIPRDAQDRGTAHRVFMERFFTTDPYSRRVEVRPEGKEEIQRLIGDIVLDMRAEDYLSLPEYVYNDLWVDLPGKARTQYDELEKNMFAEMDHGSLEVFNAAALTAKCRQLANGSIIDTETKQWHPVHDAKLDALEEVLEEAAGQGVLGAYVFRADMERIRKRFGKKYRVAYLGPGVSQTEGLQIINDWNSRKFHLLLTHPQSAGHGLNLQHGGHQIVWFGLDWALEGWLQLNARLRRQGQQASSVIVHRILARGTVDEAVRERLMDKQQDQDDLRSALSALRAYRDRKCIDNISRAA